MRYDLANPADVERLAKMQEQWQSDAWYYIDAVGEAKYAERFVANSFRRIRLYAAFVRDPDGEPIAVADAVRPTDADADLPSGEEVGTVDPADYLDQRWADEADELIRGFAARDGGQAALMERLGVNLFVPGDCYLVNRPVPVRRPNMIVDEATGARRLETVEEVGTVDDWEIRSADEIRKSTKNPERVMIVDSPNQREGVELPDSAFVERVWRKHGRWSAWADSNFRAAIGTLEELDLLARLARASIRSRLVAGMVTFPDELDFGAADQPAGEGSGAGKKAVTLDRELAELFTSVVGDEADANSIAPAIARGPKEYLDGIKVIEFPRRFGEEERAQYEDAVKRLARTIDLPVEVLLGLADLNHWTAWQVDESTYEAHIEPLVDVGVEGVTYGYLRPMLLEAGCPPEVAERIVTAADPSDLVRRPDRGKVATEGHGLFALSDEAWRKANGFGENEAPSDDELRRRLGVARSILTADLSAILLEESGILPAGTASTIAERQAGNAPAGDGTEDADSGQGTEEQPGEPDAEAAAVLAAAGRSATAQFLSVADRVLRERLLSTFDASLTRALERAGARLRTRAQRVEEARDALNAAGDVANIDVGGVLGPALVAALASDEDLFGDAFADLHDRFDSWVGDTQAAALDALADLAGEDFPPELRAEVEAEQEGDREDAWGWVLAALLAFAAARIRGGELDGDDGEFDATIAVPPGLVREALAIAGGEQVERAAAGGLLTVGGAPPGGPATGQVVRLAFARAGFPWTGYVWNYGLSPRQRPFPPHLSLSGTEFATWQDPVLANTAGEWPGVAYWHPGDHRYCRCDFAPVVSADASSEGVQQVRRSA